MGRPRHINNRINNNKMNEHFPGTIDGGNQLSLGHTSFSVSPKNEFWSSATPWVRSPWVEVSESDILIQVSRWTKTHFWQSCCCCCCCVVAVLLLCCCCSVVVLLLLFCCRFVF